MHVVNGSIPGSCGWRKFDREGRTHLIMVIKKKAKEKAKEILKLHANSWSNFIAYVRTF
jgi:hypothetical protein